MKSLFVELQTEELPPKALKKLSEAFAAGVHKSLAAQSMLTGASTVKAYGAPRRMGVLITEVLEKSPDKEFEQRLVPVRVGLDAEGKPTAALTKKMAADLLKKGRTSVKGMWSEKKGATYDAVVVLDDTGEKYVRFKLEFPKRKEGVNGR